MPNKRTGQDYLEAEMKRRNAEQHKKRNEERQKKYQDKLLRGKGAPMVPIGTVPIGKKAKPVPLKKKKKK